MSLRVIFDRGVSCQNPLMSASRQCDQITYVPQSTLCAIRDRGSFCKNFDSTHIHGTHVPVEEPPTASKAEKPIGAMPEHRPIVFGRHLPWRLVLPCWQRALALAPSGSAVILSSVSSRKWCKRLREKKARCVARTASGSCIARATSLWRALAGFLRLMLRCTRIEPDRRPVRPIIGSQFK
jgi:hypothetical protein